jgi:hypothetical protein
MHAQVYKVAEETVPAAEEHVKDLEKQVSPGGSTAGLRAAGSRPMQPTAIQECQGLLTLELLAAGG